MRKRRTRQHQIEDLSYNYVEKQVLLAFCMLRKYDFRDYGYDGTITTFHENGEIETGIIYVQVKATEKLAYSKKGTGFSLPLAKRDLELWIYETSPVVVVCYDASTDEGYFVELHSYFQKNRLTLRNINKTMTVFIDPANKFGPDAVSKLRVLKNDALWKE